MWPLTLMLIIVASLVSFAIGFVIGAELQRERLLRELRAQRRELGVDVLGRRLQ